MMRTATHPLSVYQTSGRTWAFEGASHGVRGKHPAYLGFYGLSAHDEHHH